MEKKPNIPHRPHSHTYIHRNTKGTNKPQKRNINNNSNITRTNKAVCFHFWQVPTTRVHAIHCHLPLPLNKRKQLLFLVGFSTGALFGEIHSNIVKENSLATKNNNNNNKKNICNKKWIPAKWDIRGAKGQAAKQVEESQRPKKEPKLNLLDVFLFHIKCCFAISFSWSVMVLWTTTAAATTSTKYKTKEMSSHNQMWKRFERNSFIMRSYKKNS